MATTIDINNNDNVIDNLASNELTYKLIINQYTDILEQHKESLTSQQYIDIYNNLKTIHNNSNLVHSTNNVILPVNVNISRTPDIYTNINELSRNVRRLTRNTPTYTSHDSIEDTPTCILYFSLFIAGLFFIGGGVVLKELFGKYKPTKHFISIIYIINVYVFYAMWIIYLFFITIQILFILYEISNRISSYFRQNNN